MQKDSIHLQDFPIVSGFALADKHSNLVKQMDIALSICSLALFIRDQNNLRVRLPLSSLTIIGKDAKSLASLTQIIAEEVNVKEVILEEDIAKIASFKLQLNFKKIGSKFKDKIKEITVAAKNNQWHKISENQIKIAGVILADDDFELKLSVENALSDKNIIMPLASNDYLVNLNIEITPELEQEGIARDIIRLIQQSRKEENFAVEDRVNIAIYCFDNRQQQALGTFAEYIATQVLANKIDIANSPQEILTTAETAKNNLLKPKIEQQEIYLIITKDC